MAKFDMDEWNNQRSEILELFENAFYESINGLLEDSEDEDLEAEDLEDIVDSIDPVASCINAKNILYETESWFEYQASSYLESQDANEKIGELSQHIPYGWIGLTMNPYIDSVEVAMKKFKQSGENFSDYLNENSGMAGFVKNAIEGFLNPIDKLHGIAAALEGSFDEEGNKLEKKHKRAYSEFADTVAIANNELDNIIVTKWNTNILHL